MFAQIAAVTAMNIKSLPQRLGSSAVLVIGIAGVVLVLVSVLAMATGFTKVMANVGRDDRAIVVRVGSNSEISSSMSREVAQIVADSPGVRKTAENKAIASAEVVMLMEIPRKDGGTANAVLRGVGPQAFDLRPEIHIVEGRMFQPAVHEIIVGKSAEAQFQGLNIGDHIVSRGMEWTVVGIFESGGDAHESELMADAETVLSGYRNLFQTTTVMLESKDSFDAFRDALTTNPRLSVDVKRESEFYAEQSKLLNTILSYVAYGVGSIMAIGAILAALNSMYSAVSARTREIATLRALGFGSASVIVSIFAEAAVLALIGAVIGTSLAWLLFDGLSVSTSAGSGGLFQTQFALAVTPGLIALGIVWALIIGAVGGLFPAIRAARLPVAVALRAV